MKSKLVREALVMLNLGSWGRKMNHTMKKTRVKQRMVLQNRQKLQSMQARLPVMAENEVYKMGRIRVCSGRGSLQFKYYGQRNLEKTFLSIWFEKKQGTCIF